MSRSGIPPVVFLEMAYPERPDTPTVIGSDCITHIDGRWSRATARAHIQARADEINAYRTHGLTGVPQLILLGYSVPRDYSRRLYRL